MGRLQSTFLRAVFTLWLLSPFSFAQDANDDSQKRIQQKSVDWSWSGIRYRIRKAFRSGNGSKKNKNVLSVFPRDPDKHPAFFEQLKHAVKARVIGQDQVIDTAIDKWSSGILNDRRQHSVVLILGTTGVGKSHLARVIADEAYRLEQTIRKDGYKYKEFTSESDAFLEIDMTAYKDDSKLTELFGATPSYIGYESPGGRLCKWLARRAKNERTDGGIIVLNEIDKVEADVMTAFMEIFDSGKVTCGDGKVRYLNRSLVILTANKNVQNMLPDEFLRASTCDAIDSRVARITPQQIKDAFTQNETQTSRPKQLTRELLERIDEFLFAGPLCREKAIAAVTLAVAEYARGDHRKKETSELVLAPQFAENWVDLDYDILLGVRGTIRSVIARIGVLARDHRSRFGSSKRLEIRLERDPNLMHKSTLIATNEKGEELKEKGPSGRTTSPLLDPEERAKILDVEEQLKQRIIGQPELVQIGANMIRSQVTNPNAKSPVSAYLFGVTGNGKTELAKSVAEIKCGSRDAVFEVNMGDFTSAYDFEHWLNPKNGTEGPLEKHLKRYRDCGVLLFDEMSNAGGSYLEQRRDMALKMYALLQQGVFRSAATGTTYDLRRQFIFYTGNTGQEYFFGLNSDDELLSTWEAVGNTPDKAKQLLLEDGFPPAFLGRLTYVAMARPLLHAHKKSLVRKQLGVWLSEMRRSFPMLEFRFEDAFIDDLALRVYNPKEGARSIENFIVGTIAPLVNQAILALDFDRIGDAAYKPVLKLRIETRGPTKPFFEMTPDERVALLHLTAFQGEKNIYESRSDFLSVAQFMKQILKADAWATAFHEAAHAVVNEPYLTGRKLSFLTIVPGGDGRREYLGYARYKPLTGIKTNYTEKDLISYSAQLLAGSMAERLLGRDMNTGRGGDVEQFRKAVSQIGLQAGLIPELVGVRLDKDGQPILSERQSAQYASYIAKIEKLALAEAEATLREHWILVAMTARQLMTKGYLYGDEFDTLRRHYKALNEEKRTAYEKTFNVDRNKTAFSGYYTRCSEALKEHFR